jgi:hypothetical protein
MSGLVEQRTHVEMRLQIRSPRCIVGPTWPGGPSGLVKFHGELDLPIDGLLGALWPGQPLRRGPVTMGVLAKLRGVEASHSIQLLSQTLAAIEAMAAYSSISDAGRPTARVQRGAESGGGRVRWA